MKTPGRVPMMTTQVSGQAIRPSLRYRYTPLGIATILNTKLVALTEGEVNWRKLIWKGRRRKAPETPPMEVKKETTKATSGGKKIQVVTPETPKCTRKKSIIGTRLSMPGCVYALENP